ncbi:BASIC LEUCINE ZIPPER 63 [Salix koriyanagi]|uniref:BASIC LEUCINE ZIPPER 63 n=1 Tax=Salix koriyanagi TaxID=2511006 RepID=A0A9Q0W1I9_9ROSI|nr:BASIC LEUCINE ZIPPER 63 [Salix koriyanagi]
MNRSESEWAFERFLQEASAATLEDNTSSNSSADKTDVVQIKDHGNSNNNATSKCSFSNGTCATAASSLDAPASFPVESDDYHAFLKSKLNLACAAVALTRVNLFLLSLLLKLRIYVLYLYFFV